MLDNCEHVVAGRGRARGHVLDSCPDPRILCTSREPLGVEGEALLALEQLARRGELEALERSDAIALFVDRARLARWDFELNGGNTAAVARVCGRLDGLPLALELAAARVRSLPGRDRRAPRQALLAAGPAARPRRGAPPHAAATVDWSYRLLAEPERRASTGCRCCRRWTSRRPKPSAGRGLVHAILELLDRLVERSLVVRTTAGGRATQCSRRSGITRGTGWRSVASGSARELHAEHFGRVADARGTTPRWSGRGIAALRQAGFADARAAVHWSVRERPNRERALRIVAPLWSLAHSRHATEALELCEEALAALAAGVRQLGQAALGLPRGRNFVAGRPERRTSCGGGDRRRGAGRPVRRHRPPRARPRDLRVPGPGRGGPRAPGRVVQAAAAAGVRAVELEMRVLRARHWPPRDATTTALRGGRRPRRGRGEQPGDARLGPLHPRHGAQGTGRRARAQALLSNRALRGCASGKQYSSPREQPCASSAGRPARQGAREAARRLLCRLRALAQQRRPLRRAGTCCGRARPPACPQRPARAGRPRCFAGAHHEPPRARPAPLEGPPLAELRGGRRRSSPRGVAPAQRAEDVGPAVLGQLRALRPPPAVQRRTPPARSRCIPPGGRAVALRLRGGSTAHLPDLKGLHDLARLLAAPGQGRSTAWSSRPRRGRGRGDGRRTRPRPPGPRRRAARRAGEVPSTSGASPTSATSGAPPRRQAT